MGGTTGARVTSCSSIARKKTSISNLGSITIFCPRYSTLWRIQVSPTVNVGGGSVSG